MSTHYINGSFVNDDHALISISDLGLTRGLGVCDILRTYRKKPFHLQDHLKRLKFSVHELGLNMPEDTQTIAGIIDQLLETFPEDELCIRTMITGGISAHRFMPDRKASLMISALPMISFSKEYYSNGASACTTGFERPFPQCKTLFYAPALRAIRDGEKYGALEALYLNQKREFLEGLTSNFFAFFGNTLVTSSDNHILCGITREVVLRVAEGHFPVEMRTIPYAELKEMDEAFITSCTKEILPVTQIDGVEIGSGFVGSNTQKLMELFRAYTLKKDWPLLNIPLHQSHSERSSPLTS